MIADATNHGRIVVGRILVTPGFVVTGQPDPALMDHDLVEVQGPLKIEPPPPPMNRHDRRRAAKMARRR